MDHRVKCKVKIIELLEDNMTTKLRQYMQALDKMEKFFERQNLSAFTHEEIKTLNCCNIGEHLHDMRLM